MSAFEESQVFRAWVRDKKLERARVPPRPHGAVGPSTRKLAAALRSPGAKLSVIAQPARRSPEEGRLRDDLDVFAFAQACVHAGVAALALATDPRFGLRPSDWAPVLSPRFPLPVLHQDLVVSPAQVLEARLLGADGAWLHAAALDDDALAQCVALCGHFDMAAVVEGGTPDDMARAVEAGAQLVCASAFDDMGAQNEDVALELLRALPREIIRVVRGPVSGAAGLQPLRGEVDALWICGPASMPRDTYGYLRPLVDDASQE